MTTNGLPRRDAIKTYRYLRIGMVGAAVLLFASVLIEREQVDYKCWQESISAYYYTPVRPIFVGSLLAISLALIVIKGRNTWEDVCLNFAGMLAPVVAVVPTLDIDDCWSLAPDPPTLGNGLAPWVEINIHNNFRGLLIAGVFALVMAVLTATIDRIRGGEDVGRGKIAAIVLGGVALAFGWWAVVNRSDFPDRAHGYAALGFFGFLGLAVAGNAFRNFFSRRMFFFWLYSTVAVLMIVGGLIIWQADFGEWRHRILVLEEFEIVLFIVFWLAQTWEHWDEQIATPAGA